MPILKEPPGQCYSEFESITSILPAVLELIAAKASRREQALRLLRSGTPLSVMLSKLQVAA